MKLARKIVNSQQDIINGSINSFISRVLPLPFLPTCVINGKTKSAESIVGTHSPYVTLLGLSHIRTYQRT